MTRYQWLLFALLLFIAAPRMSLAEPPAGTDFSQVPGTVIYHSPASSGIYLGSPGIAILPDGAYLAKCDEFGPKSTEHQSAISLVFRSEDQGKTWRQTARLDGLFWASIFVHRGSAYLLGTHKHHGRIVIFRSEDGMTWSEPKDTQHGLLTPEGEYHTAPVPILQHAGRLWRAAEDASGGKRWGFRYQAMMMSAPLDADLLKRESWTFSNVLKGNPQWRDGRFGGWLEGNAVLTPQGEVVNLLRVADPRGGVAARVHISPDGKRASFDPSQDFQPMPGGAKKFSIRYDKQSGRYWSLVNWVPPKYSAEHAAGTRNTLALVSSTDLTDWKLNCILLHHPDRAKHGFQYPDWLFDGKDILAAVRTGYDDGLGGAHNAHDANFLTLHRFRNFRELTLADSVIPAQSLGLENE